MITIFIGFLVLCMCVYKVAYTSLLYRLSFISALYIACYFGRTCEVLGKVCFKAGGGI